MVVLSFITVGMGFLLHEVAHRVVAIEFGQTAEFRADYQMLFLAIMGALVGFLFAAPGAVYHRGQITERENGLIALAGPVTNLLLALLFLPLMILPGILGVIGQMGIWINLFLAAFNMIPFGPLDGKSVLAAQGRLRTGVRSKRVVGRIRRLLRRAVLKPGRTLPDDRLEHSLDSVDPSAGPVTFCSPPRGPSSMTDTDDEDRLTYAETGVDIDASEDATAALLEAFGSDLRTEYAGLLDIGDRYLALATDGVGTKLLVAEAIEDFSTIGIDCIAMNANDLVAAGVEPVAFVDYLAIDEPDEELTNQIGEGLAVGLEQADLTMLGGETAVMPEVVKGSIWRGPAPAWPTKTKSSRARPRSATCWSASPRTGFTRTG